MERSYFPKAWYFIAIALLPVAGCSDSQFTGNSTAKKSSPAANDADTEKNGQDELADSADDQTANYDGDAGGAEDDLLADSKRECKKYVAVSLVIDTSGSMGRVDVNVNVNVPDPNNPQDNQVDIDVDNTNTGEAKRQMDFVIESVQEFVSNLESKDYVGLSRFSTDAEGIVPLSEDKAPVIEALTGLNPDGNTNIVGGLNQGLTSLKQLPADLPHQKFLVLLSDGRHNQEGDPVVTAGEMKQNNPDIKFITIGYKLKDEGKDALTQIASTPDSYLDAPSSESVVQKFQELSENICDY